MCRWQTPEDQPPTRTWSTLHYEGTSDEMIRVEMPIRIPWWHRRKAQLVIRAYQGSEEVTATLEAIRVEK